MGAEGVDEVTAAATEAAVPEAAVAVEATPVAAASATAAPAMAAVAPNAVRLLPQTLWGQIRQVWQGAARG